MKQIVGGTLDQAAGRLQTNFVSDRPASWYAELYGRDGLRGGHIVLLGPGNEREAAEALAAYPGGLQLGGGVHLENARRWLEAGASHVIVTSWVFSEGRIHWDRLRQLSREIGKSRLVIDLSCRRREEGYVVVTDRFQKLTAVVLNRGVFEEMAPWCTEFLVHAVDVEGLCRGIDVDLVARLAEWSPLPATYAGGARCLSDLEQVSAVGQGRVDLTIGSALDIFGGTGVRYADAVAFNRRAGRGVSGPAPTAGS